MSAARKSGHTAKAATRATTRKAATRRAAPRKATTRRGTTSAARRRSGTTTRRARPKVATTVGAALGTLVVSLLVDASWPVRIGLVLLALVLVGGYVYLQGRRHNAAQPAADESAPSVEPSTSPPSTSPPSTPTPSTPTPPAPTTEDTP